VALQFFWCKILINCIQIHKFYAIRSYVVIFSSPQVICPPKIFSMEKKIFVHISWRISQDSKFSVLRNSWTNSNEKICFHRKNFWEEIWVVDLKIWLQRIELRELYESKNRLSISYTKKTVERRKVRENNAWKVLFWRSVVNLARMASHAKKF